jgi:hypothetical protein
VPDNEQAKRKMIEIRFDCLVTMYDLGFKKIKPGFEFEKRKRTPQCFKSIQNITLESIKYSDEATLGRLLKEMYYELEHHIRQYEDDFVI